MNQLSVFQQHGYTARFEWGREGVQALAPPYPISLLL